MHNAPRAHRLDVYDHAVLWTFSLLLAAAVRLLRIRRYLRRRG